MLQHAVHDSTYGRFLSKTSMSVHAFQKLNSNRFRFKKTTLSFCHQKSNIHEKIMACKKFACARLRVRTFGTFFRSNVPLNSIWRCKNINLRFTTKLSRSIVRNCSRATSKIVMQVVTKAQRTYFHWLSVLLVFING